MSFGRKSVELSLENVGQAEQGLGGASGFQGAIYPKCRRRLVAKSLEAVGEGRRKGCAES